MGGRVVQEIVRAIKQVKNNNGTVLVCGNGGSAATAEHLVNDLFKTGVKALCLNSNISLLTMIANDYGYKEVFSRQIKMYGQNDLLITISCSGTSPNIVEAINTASCLGIKSFEFPKFKEAGKHIFCDYGKLEDAQLILAHKIANSLI